MMIYKVETKNGDVLDVDSDSFREWLGTTGETPSYNAASRGVQLGRFLRAGGIVVAVKDWEMDEDSNFGNK